MITHDFHVWSMVLCFIFNICLLHFSISFFSGQTGKLRFCRLPYFVYCESTATENPVLASSGDASLLVFRTYPAPFTPDILLLFLASNERISSLSCIFSSTTCGKCKIAFHNYAGNDPKYNHLISFSLILSSMSANIVTNDFLISFVSSVLRFIFLF